MSPFGLENKVAIVTGGTRGIGRAIVETFARAGARVVASSENAGACQQAETECKDMGLNVVGFTCDVRDDKQQRALVDKAISEFGGLDIVVANAGITGPSGGTVTASADAYAEMMSINLTSIVRLSGMSIPHLAARGGGSLIFMSSISAIRGNKAIGPYALSKAALAQLARNLAVELGPQNIRANAIAPGLIRTELASSLLSDPVFMETRMKMTPLRRPGEPSEVAGAALFLASPAGAFVTGQIMVVDGGTVITDGS